MTHSSLPERIRRDFPILSRTVHGKPLVYLDNAASAQKPLAVIEAQREYLSNYHANIHRGAHHLAQLATEAYESTRQKIANHIGAYTTDEVIFTAGSTDAINLVAQSWGRTNIAEGDTILVTQMEHHANIVPWQMLCEEKRARLIPIAVHPDGTLDLDDLDQALRQHEPKLVGVVHASNTLGTINPVEAVCRAAKAAGAITVVDGSQALPHLAINMQTIGCDFYVATGHKAYGPTGVGFLWGRKALLNAMPPWRGGGEMIHSVSFEGTTYNEIPHKFEAGTPHISGGIAFGVALDWMNGIGLESIHHHETELVHHAQSALETIPNLKVIGTANQKVGVVSMVVDGHHPYDLGTLLDGQGIAVRTGHHCTEPLMAHMGLSSGTLRMSFAAYTTREEIDRAVIALERAINMLN
ncbi:MAG: cysteine desulfurase CsdA [Crocinitomicaceae bacterium]|nr:cysteine desulfurase CsdA [Crocinitomicaceae bacterium]